MPQGGRGPRIAGSRRGSSTRLLAGPIHSERAKAYGGIASRLKAIASIAVHDYGREATFSRAEIGFLIRTTASLASLVLEAVPEGADSSESRKDRDFSRA